MSECIPLSSLSKKTRDNLAFLQEHGFTWEDEATKEMVDQPKVRERAKRTREILEERLKTGESRLREKYGTSPARPGEKSYLEKRIRCLLFTKGVASSFYVKGTDPEGNPVVYCRKETSCLGAGQTFLRTPYGNISLYLLRDKLKGAVHYAHTNLPTSLLSVAAGKEDYALESLEKEAEFWRAAPHYTAKKALFHYFPEEKKYHDELLKPSEIRQEYGAIVEEIKKIREGKPEEE